MSEEKVLTLRGKKAVWAPGGGSGPIDPNNLPTEEWTFTLEDGSIVTKKVVVAE